MAKSIPHFGDAVHAVLPYIMHGGDPTQLGRLAFEDVLYHYHERERASFKGEVLKRIFSYWQYIGEVVNLADKVWVEPQTPNGKRPDLVLEHRRHIYVVDVKCLNPNASLRGVSGEEMRVQVYGSAIELAKRLPPCVPIYAYVLRFDNCHVEELGPRWTLLGKINV